MNGRDLSPGRRAALALIAFLLGLLLFDRLISLAVRAYAQQRYENNEFEAQLRRYLAAHRCNGLILGTSRAYEGIIPAQLDGCLPLRFFKEAYAGKGPKYNFLFYQLFKKHAGVPRLVVYAVDYFMYNDVSEQRWLARFRFGNLPRLNLFAAPLLLLQLKKRHDIFFNNMINDWTLAWQNRATRGAALIDAVNDYPGAEVPATGGPQLVSARPTGYFARYDFASPPGNEGRFFTRLLETLRRDGVRVALVSLPDHYGTYVSNRQLEAFHDHLRRLNGSFANTTALVYNRPDRFDLQNPALFLDGGWGQVNSHLSAAGARQLSRRLCLDLQALTGSRPGRHP